MSYPLLRRLPLSTLDRRVARASMQICHKTVIHQLYISRANACKQWVVVSNPSEECVDLTGYSLSCTGCSDVFYFPTKYTLLPGDEVTVWCFPESLKLDEDNLLEPYLFWTQGDGSLRQTPFFSSAQANEVILCDPLLVEVASIRVTVDGKREFRVLHCKAAHPKSLRSEIDTRFCVGCLSPPNFKKQTSQSTPESGKIISLTPNEREIYVFSRYWGVVSDKSLSKHFIAVILVPLVESVRAVMIFLMSSMFQPVATRKVGPQLLSKATAFLFVMLTCDIIARRLMLCIKSGLLVTIASFTSVVLDQVAVLVLYWSLQSLYPVLSTSFQYMLTLDLGVTCANAVAVHVRFLDARCNWHPLFKQLARWDHGYLDIIGICGIGRNLLLYLLLFLPVTTQPSQLWKTVGYLLVPLFTAASGIDFLRALAALLHMLQLLVKQIRSHQKLTHVQEMDEQQEEKDLSEEEPEKEVPRMVFSTPKNFRFRSRDPYN